MNESKVYVSTQVYFNSDGKMMPRTLTWEDGRTYEIDRVSEVRQMAAVRAGGQGDRYTIWVNGQMRYLFFERSFNRSGETVGRWFVERRAV